LILFFQNKIRKFLYPNKNNLGLWVNIEGNCLSKLIILLIIIIGSKGLRRRITDCIENVIPNTSIGLAELRRIIPSIIFREDLNLNGMHMDQFLSEYAKLVNTSTQVI
jgi:hypothetical protein